MMGAEIAMLKHVVIGVVGLGLAASSRGVAETKCAELEGAKAQVLLDYLQRDQSSLSAACITYAMSHLAYPPAGELFDRYPEVIKTMVGYLDYRIPDESKLAAAVNHRDPFPADSALFAVGKPAVPDLLDAIASSVTRDLARSNAIWVLFTIYREDVAEAVRVLKRAAKAKEPTDFEASLRLYDAAKRAADMCTGPYANGCIDALYEVDSDKKPQ
jgi:hypothetical protein